MSSQSVTNLSQPASRIFHKDHIVGGKDKFPSGPAGQIALKIRTDEDNTRLRQEGLDTKQRIEDEKKTGLKDFHYITMKAQESNRRGLGMMDLPSKFVGAIPGYSGMIPRKEATNVIGSSYKRCNLTAAELFAVEQDIFRNKQTASIKPDQSLKTPYTGDY